ncbi:CsgG/HfaB family protein [Elusimicrobiota bacterium]
MKSSLITILILSALLASAAFAGKLSAETLCSNNTAESVFNEFLNTEPSRSEYYGLYENNMGEPNAKAEAQRLTIIARKMGYTNVNGWTNKSRSEYIEHTSTPFLRYYYTVCVSFDENIPLTEANAPGMAAVKKASIPENERSRIAVTDFDSLTEQVSKLEVVAISGFLRSALVETNIFRVINRQDMNKLLSEMRIQQSGYASSAGAAQAGKVLNAQKVIVGSVSTLGEVYYININMVNVETHEIKFAKSIAAHSVDDLQSAMNKLAVEIAKSVLNKEGGKQ